jgi:hypothetical protein
MDSNHNPRTTPLRNPVRLIHRFPHMQEKRSGPTSASSPSMPSDAAFRHPTLGVGPFRGSPLLVAFDRIADEPDRRWPQTDEERAAFGVPTLVLIDGLGADPQTDTQRHRPHRQELHVPRTQAGAVEKLAQHRLIVALG